MATVVATLFALCSQAGSQELSIGTYRAKYEIEFGVVEGSLVTKVIATEDGLSATSVVKPNGGLGTFGKETITEHAEFSIEDGWVRPRLYSSVDELSNHPKNLDFLFDWKAGIVAGTVNDERYEHQLDGNTHDRITILYQLMLDLRRGEQASFYRLMDGKRMKDLALSRLPIKRIKTPYGKFEVVGIQYDHTKRDRQVVLWCAEDLGYLPVVIEVYQTNQLMGRAVLRSYDAPE